MYVVELNFYIFQEAVQALEIMKHPGMNDTQKEGGLSHGTYTAAYAYNTPAISHSACRDCLPTDETMFLKQQIKATRKKLKRITPHIIIHT